MREPVSFPRESAKVSSCNDLRSFHIEQYQQASGLWIAPPQRCTICGLLKAFSTERAFDEPDQKPFHSGLPHWSRRRFSSDVPVTPTS